MAKTQSIEIQIKALMSDYSEKVKTASRSAVKKVAGETAKRLKSSSPVRTGEYASGWTIRQVDADTVAVYNRKAPGLTHLLEHGHLTKNKRGVFGRTPAHVHIKPVEEWANEELQEEIRRRLEK